MKYYIIAGEASGDLHGSNLIKALKKEDLAADIRCWGGDLMQKAGGNVVKHIRDLAFMGFVEVLTHVRTIFKNLEFCKKDVLEFAPDVLVLVDYPGFNLRIATWAKKKGFEVVYYISPQIWAWKENRVYKIIKSVDRMLVILPFEKDFYKKYNYEVDYVGHPLIQVVDEFLQDHRIERQGEKKTVALLPGSRKQEIRTKLPIMLQMVSEFPDQQFIVAKAPSMDDQFYAPFLKKHPGIKVSRDTYQVLMNADAAIVTSGTATLETALFNVPEIVCYKANPISYAIGKRLIKVKFISLVNLIMNREVVKELIQNDFNSQHLKNELGKLLFDKNRRTTIYEDYNKLRMLLNNKTDASQNAANIVVAIASE